jgi:UDPglucose 6-dehydrogenase
MIITDVQSAEMIKYASNAFLATKISFANAIANICESAGADVVQVVKGMGLDSRIGQAFLQAGIGYGGSCFPKDTRSLLHTARKFGYDFPLLDAAIATNDEQPRRFIARMEQALGGFENKKVAVLGLAFKANTDDIRDAKSLDVIGALLAGGAEVTAYDPIAIENTRRVFPQIGYAKNAFEAAAGADAVIVVTEWNEFKQINLERLKATMAGDFIFDGRNLYDPAKMKRIGFSYHCVGRSGDGCSAPTPHTPQTTISAKI